MVDSALKHLIKPKLSHADDSKELARAFHKIESALHRELQGCYLKLNAQDEPPSSSLLKSIAEIQCAIDIIHSADTSEQRRHVYSILKEIRAA